MSTAHVLLLLLGGAAASGAAIPALMGTTFSLWGAQNALKRLLEYSLSTPRAKRLSYYNATFTSRVHDLHTRWLMWFTFHMLSKRCLGYEIFSPCYQIKYGTN